MLQKWRQQGLAFIASMRRVRKHTSSFAKPLREKVWGFELMMRLEEDTMIVSCDFSRPLSDFFKPLSVVMGECGVDCGAASHDEVRRFDFEFLNI